MLTDGVYHADPHPGTSLVQPKPNGEFTVSSGRLRRGGRGIAADAARHRRRHSGGATRLLIRAMRSMGFIARGADPRLFDRVIDFFARAFTTRFAWTAFRSRICGSIPSSRSKIWPSCPRWACRDPRSGRSFSRPQRVDPPRADRAPHHGAVHRSSTRSCSRWRSFGPTWRSSSSATRPIGRRSVRTSRELGTTLIALPNELDKVLRQAERGELEVRFRGFGPEAQLIYSLGHQVIFTALGIAAASLAVVFSGRDEALYADRVVGAPEPRACCCCGRCGRRRAPLDPTLAGAGGAARAMSSRRRAQHVDVGLRAARARQRTIVVDQRAVVVPELLGSSSTGTLVNGSISPLARARHGSRSTATSTPLVEAANGLTSPSVERGQGIAHMRSGMPASSITGNGS